MKKFYLLGGMAVATALFAAASTFPFASPEQMGGGKSSVNQQVTDVYADPATQADGAKSVPYYSPIALNSSSFADGWTSIDHNNEKGVWDKASDSNAPGGTGYVAKISTWAAATSSQDDYLISPLIHLEADVEYAIAYNFRVYNNTNAENLTVYLTKGNTLEDVEADDKILLKEHLNYTETSYKQFAAIYTPEESGDYCVAFWCHSDGNKYYPYVADLLVAKNEFAPGAVSGLKATPGANHELSCKLEWTLPTTDAFGAAIPADKPITAVKVYRDGTEIENTNLDGTATEFIDTEATGLTSGKHTYEVSVVADGVEGAKTQVGPTAYVGPLAPASLPADFTIASEDDYGMWTTVDDTKTWQYYKDYSYGPCAVYNYIGNVFQTADNWLITPPINVETEGIYRLTATTFTTEDEGQNFEICLLSSADVATATQTEVVTDWTIERSTTSTNPKQNYSFDFKLNVTGTYYIGFHNKTNRTSNTYAKVYFSSVAVQKSSFVPGVVTDVTATPATDYSKNINVSWTNPTTSLTGDALEASDYQIEIYLNDAETPAKTVDGDQTSATVAVEEDGIYTVTVKAVATDSDHGTAPNPPSVTTKWVGDKSVELPYSTEFAASDATVTIWEAVDANHDGNTFSWSSSNGFAVSSSNGYDDYVISPVFNASAGFYKAEFMIANRNFNKTIPAIAGIVSKDAFDATNEDCYLAKTSIEASYNYNGEEYTLIFEVKEAGDYQFVLGAKYASSVTNDFCFKKLSIDAAVLLPGDVTALSATVTGDNNDSVELTWTNPSVMFNSEIALTAIDKVVILRDDEEIQSITADMEPGQAASFTDTNVPGGTHTYSVKVVDAEGKAHDGKFPSVTTDWVGGGQSAPIDLTSNNHPFPAWSFVDVDGNHAANEGMYTWKSFSKKYVLEGGNNFTNNDYLISSPINLKNNEVYKITYFMSSQQGGNNSNVNIAVKMGSHKADAKSYLTVHTINLPAEQSFKDQSFYVAVGKASEEDVTPASNGIMTLADGDLTPEDYYNLAAKIPAAGDYRVALHHTEKGGVQVSEFHVAKVADYTPTTEIVEVGAGKVTFDGQAVNFAGEAAVQVYNIAGVCVAADDAAEGYFNVAKLGAGYYIVKVTSDAQTITMKVTVK